MDALFPRCAGLDVHKANVVACVRIVGLTGKATKQVRTFSSMSSRFTSSAPGSNSFVGQGNTATLLTSTQTYGTVGFGSVNIVASQGSFDQALISSIVFILTETGNWR